MRTNIHLNYNKCYHETGTKEIYLFDHQRFKEALEAYADQNNKTLEDVYKNIDTLYIDKKLRKNGKRGIAPGTLRKYAYINYVGEKKDNQVRVPKTIEECQVLGTFLCENAYAFLHSFKAVDTEERVKDIYEQLYDILFLYDTSECFNTIPNQHLRIEATTYFNELMDEVIKQIHKVFLFDKDIREKLLVIAEDTKVFLQRYEVPGVVDTWLQVNPNLRYYDAVFDFIEEDTTLYEKVRNEGYGALHFSFYPTQQEIEERRTYWKQKAALPYSEATHFKEELLATLTLLFEQEFPQL